jgi:putative transposase
VSCFRFIAAKKATFPISLLCEVLGVSRSGFHAWQRRAPSRRERSDVWLTERIRQIHQRTRGVYGAPRVHAQLRHEGVRVSRKRVERLMREAGLSGLIKKRRGKTTIRVCGVRTAPDLVERDFAPTEPDRLWCADITYIRTWEGWLYVASVMDCYSRRIVGWSMADHLRAELVVDALGMAVARRRPDAGLIHHSDQGSQPGVNRSSQQCVREMNLGVAGDGSTGVRRGDSVGVARLSSRRLARRAGRSGDSRVRAVRGPVVGAAGVTVFGRGDSDPSLRERRIVSCRQLRPPLPGAR